MGILIVLICIRGDIMIKYVARKDITYGISAIDENGNILRTFPHIETNKRAVSKLVSLCNSEKLELEHLADVVEDFVK